LPAATLRNIWKPRFAKRSLNREGENMDVSEAKTGAMTSLAARETSSGDIAHF